MGDAVKEAWVEFREIARKLGATEKVVGDYSYRSKRRRNYGRGERPKYLYVRLIGMDRAGTIRVSIFKQ